MPNNYSAQDWKRFRQEVIELDGYACRRCSHRLADGAVLQVHHLYYSPGKMPWEDPYEACETLCQGCHAREHGIIRPNVGWNYLGMDDLEDLDGNCQLCGQAIRYVFHIQHPDWEPMAVGTDCCDSLTGTQLASNHMESIQRFQSRRNRFVSSKRWKEEDGGLAIRQKGIELRVVPNAGQFQILMDEVLGRKRYATLEAAKLLAFEVIENGKAAECIAKRRLAPTGKKI